MTLAPHLRKDAAALLLLALLGAAAVKLAGARAFLEVAWPDEYIYLVGARNLVEKGSFNTNYYLTHSLLRRGYPHRDVHLPGYILALAPFVERRGAVFEAGVALNEILYFASIALVYLIARGLGSPPLEAAVAGGLFAILPPFPSYLHVVFPEITTCFALLVAVAWLVCGRGRLHAPIAGLLFALGALMRETLLLTLPLYFFRLERRAFLRGFLPGAALGLLLFVAPFARDRAVHPNALFPSLVEEALREPEPATALAGLLARNVASNLRDLSRMRPLASAEDAVLGLLLLLTVAPLASWSRLDEGGRRFARGVLAGVALLTLAALLVYVVRERGGVWGGVRAYMAQAPLLVVLLAPALVRGRRGPTAAALTLGLAVALLAMNEGQLYHFMRDRQASREDQQRQARYFESYVDRYSPQRVVGRLFLYGIERYPAEVIWSVPRDGDELGRLVRAIPFEFVALHNRNELRRAFVKNPRYVRINRDDPDPELLIWRRLY